MQIYSQLLPVKSIRLEPENKHSQGQGRAQSLATGCRQCIAAFSLPPSFDSNLKFPTIFSRFCRSYFESVLLEKILVFHLNFFSN